jgi:hypothetical protein
LDGGLNTDKHNNQPTILGCLKFPTSERSDNNHQQSIGTVNVLLIHCIEPGLFLVQQNLKRNNKDEMCDPISITMDEDELRECCTHIFCFSSDLSFLRRHHHGNQDRITRRYEGQGSHQRDCIESDWKVRVGYQVGRWKKARSLQVTAIEGATSKRRCATLINHHCSR